MLKPMNTLGVTLLALTICSSSALAQRGGRGGGGCSREGGSNMAMRGTGGTMVGNALAMSSLGSGFTSGSNPAVFTRAMQQLQRQNQMMQQQMLAMRQQMVRMQLENQQLLARIQRSGLNGSNMQVATDNPNAPLDLVRARALR